MATEQEAKRENQKIKAIERIAAALESQTEIFKESVDESPQGILFYSGFSARTGRPFIGCDPGTFTPPTDSA